MEDDVRLKQLLARTSESLWFVPSSMAASAVLLSYVTLEIDRSVQDGEAVRGLWFVFDVGTEGAHTTLSAIAQSVITVTGVVFSVTVVALQLAASQYTSRVLRTFLKDRGTKIVLGTFIATFTYTLLVERTVGSSPTDDEPFVPAISVTIAILMMLLSIVALIYFVNHIAQTIRASVIISNVAGDARRLVDRLFPENLGKPVDRPTHEGVPPAPGAEAIRIKARKGGYLQTIDEDTLFRMAAEARSTIFMARPIGHFMLPGETIAFVEFESRESDPRARKKILRQVEAAFGIGSEWTLEQDLERALVELSDIAVRALSPSLNDPTTATMALDRLGEVLTLRGTREEPAAVRSDESGSIRLVTHRLSWERSVEVAFEKIRLNARAVPSVMVRLIECCGGVRRLVGPDRQTALEQQIRLAQMYALTELDLEEERGRIERATAAALEAVAPNR